MKPFHVHLEGRCVVLRTADILILLVFHVARLPIIDSWLHIHFGFQSRSSGSELCL